MRTRSRARVTGKVCVARSRCDTRSFTLRAGVVAACKAVVERAERYGMDFALSMIKLRGFGGAQVDVDQQRVGQAVQHE